VLDPDAVIRIDGVARIATAGGRRLTVRERRADLVKQLVALARAEFGPAALIDRSVGLIHAPRGKLSRALTFTFTNAKITRVEVIGDPARLRELDIAVL
jgi:RNA polymerase sigma-70 factor (ECF subfamily)